MNPKVLLAVLIFVAIVIVGTTFSRHNIPSEPGPALVAVTEFAGVRLGESPSDTIAALGSPNGMTEPVAELGHTRFDYVYSNLKLEVVFYGEDKDSMKAGIICTSAPWAKLLGFAISGSESSVTQHLGKPDSISVSDDGLSKISSFKKWKAAFVFEHGAVKQMCATLSGSMNYNDDLLKAGPQRKHSRPVVPKTNISNEASERLGVENATTANAQATAPENIAAGPEICAPNLTKEERLGIAEETLEAECKYLVDWFKENQKTLAPGDDGVTISSSRLREKYRERHSLGAKHYKKERQKHIERLLKAARAFLSEIEK